MQHQTLINVILVALLIAAVLTMRAPSPTGATVDLTESDVNAKRLHDDVKSFFDVQAVLFPNGACGDVAMQLYEDVALRPLDTSTGFSNPGPERISSTNFVIDRLRRYGTLDMIRGENLLEDYDADSALSLSVESVVAVPKAQRMNFLSLDLFGESNGLFLVKRGRFATPSFECIFVVVVASKKQ